MSDLAGQLRRWSDSGTPIVVEEVRARARRRSRQVLAGALAGVAAVAAGAIALVQLDSPAVERVTAGAGGETRTTPTQVTGLGSASVGVAGTLGDGRPFAVRRHPQWGLCVTLGDVEIGCDEVMPASSGDARPPLVGRSPQSAATCPRTTRPSFATRCFLPVPRPSWSFTTMAVSAKTASSLTSPRGFGRSR